MIATFIIDCSIAMAWCFEDEATPKSTKILDRLEEESALVPPLWYLEVVNVLAMAEKRKQISTEKSDEFLSMLQKLDIEIDDAPADRALTHLLPFCRSHRLTSYDSVYLDLALRHKLPLASLDDDLRRSAKSLGVQLLGK